MGLPHLLPPWPWPWALQPALVLLLTLPLARGMGARARANWQREVEMRIEHFATTTDSNKQRAPVLQCFPWGEALGATILPAPRFCSHPWEFGEGLIQRPWGPDTPRSHFHSRASGRFGKMGSYPWYFVNKQKPGAEDAHFCTVWLVYN